MAEETPNPQSEELVDQEIVEESPILDETESVETDQESEEGEEKLPSEDEDSNLVKSERGQKRIQELANKAKKAEELEKEINDLRQRLAPKRLDPSTEEVIEEIRGETDTIPYTGDYLKDLQLAEQRAVEKALRTFGYRQAVIERLNQDINDLEQEYPELKKGSKEFDPDLTHEIVTLYEDASKANPSLKLKPFVDRIMRLKNQSEKKAKSMSAEEIIELDSNSALRPDRAGVKRVNKDPKDMTLEELEKIVPR